MLIPAPYLRERQDHLYSLTLLCCVVGMLLMGFLLRNIPVITDGVYIDFRWSASLRNIALAIILARAGLGLDPTVCATDCICVISEHRNA